VPVVNGADAFSLNSQDCTDQPAHRLGLPHPRHADQHARAGRRASPPGVSAPGEAEHWGQRREDSAFDALKDLRSGVARVSTSESITPRSSRYHARLALDVRVEVLDGRFLYAIRVFPNHRQVQLVPADICQPDGRRRTPPVFRCHDPRKTGDRHRPGYCPVDLPARTCVWRVHAATGDRRQCCVSRSRPHRRRGIGT